MREQRTSAQGAIPVGGPVSGTARKMRFRGGGFVQQRRPVMALLVILGIILVWQGVSSAGLINRIFLPSPARVMTALWGLIVSGELWRHLSASLGRIVYGWLLGTAAGITLGLLIGLFSGARAVGVPLVAAIYPVPKIALLPLLILWLGIGELSKVVTIAASVFFPTAIATFSGVDSVPRNLIRMAQSFNVPLRAIIWKVLLPGALPGILSGFRISVAAALLVLVAAEMIGAQFGLGAFLIATGNMMQTDRLMAGVVVLSALGLAMGAIISFLERKLLTWR
ncbi:ABC transporter permease [Halodurantibacterium flavum]|uniref:ABC transporter permease n=1 Tax=Halodurantibacterium flavum TaxID=1382802 RepID=A0ABW4S2S5_9RHOB